MHKHKERKEETKITINQSGTNQPAITAGKTRTTINLP